MAAADSILDALEEARACEFPACQVSDLVILGSRGRNMLNYFTVVANCYALLHRRCRAID